MIKISHPNWHDRTIEVVEIKPQQLIRDIESNEYSMDIIFSGTDEKQYGLRLTISKSDFSKSVDELVEVASDKLKEFSVNS